MSAVVKKNINENRSKELDIIKGITIFLVVYGHVIQYTSINNYNFFENYIFKLIYIFHMPVFGLLSGFLFYNLKNKEFKDLSIVKQIIQKKFMQLIVPAIVWTLIVGVIKIGFNIIMKNELSLLSQIITLVKSIPMNLWFLWGIFYCSLAIVIIEGIFNGRKKIYGISLIIMMLIPDIFNLHLYKYIYFYFMIGYLTKKYNFKKSINIKTLVVIFLVGFCLWNTETYIYNSKMFLFGEFGAVHQLQINLFRFVIGLIGSYLFIFCIHKLLTSKNKKFVVKWFNNLGNKSLGIYIISSYSVEVLAMVKVPYINNITHMIVTTVLITIITIWVTIKLINIIQKNKWLNRYLLGGR